MSPTSTRMRVALHPLVAALAVAASFLALIAPLHAQDAPTQVEDAATQVVQLGILHGWMKYAGKGSSLIIR